MKVMDVAGLGEELVLWMLRVFVFVVGVAVLNGAILLAQRIAGMCH